MRLSSIAFLLLCVSVGGCDTPTFDFDFTHSSPEYLIRGDSDRKGDDGLEDNVELLPELTFAGGWTSFHFGSGIGDVDSRIEALETLQVTVSGIHPETGVGADIGFIQRLELYVLGEDGLPSFLLASFSQRDIGTTVREIPLEIHEFVDILPYVEDDLEFQVFLQGRHPKTSVEIQTHMVLRGYGSKK